MLALAVVVYALSGYRQGFVVGSASTLGLLAGGFFGIQVTPLLLDGYSPSPAVTVAALVIVIALGLGGQAAGAFIGAQIRSRVMWQPARALDALGGAALSVVAMLLIAWVLGVAVSGARLTGLNKEVRASVILGAVDSTLPGGADRLLETFSALVDSAAFPRYLEPFAPERIKSVEPPSAGIAQRRQVVAAADSVVKVLGSATDCDRTVEGSGFVYAPGRVMTNAHVVAGVSEPVVQLGDDDLAAEVVYYDPDVDVAVLSVPELQAPALQFDDQAESGDNVAVLGYPENGPYDVQPARVRDEQLLRSPNIYGEDTVMRDTYSIFGLVRQGNSGGPLVNRRGVVIGVIFAASVTDADTGYALTSGQVERAADAGDSLLDPVGTGSCAL
ncbi:MAG: MarP family serine protease [Propionibacteriales bacterium]|jgi:S1-C subfamily serine protease|nr:MarP family serine protease [Propionibacteriales bacterium]